MNKKENNKIEENNVDSISDYEKSINKCKKMAQIIWDNPFLNGLVELDKNQLIHIIKLLVNRISEYKNLLQDENEFEAYSEEYKDLKYFIFDCKRTLIEILDKDFFENKEI